MRQALRRLLALSLGLCGAGITQAHDLWIEPSEWAPDAATRIAVTLCVGEHFSGRPAKRNASRIEEFFAAGAGGRLAIVGLDGSDPAGSVRIAAPGGYVLAYRNNHAFVELTREKFEEYLREQGLEWILARREAARGGAGKVREAYTRYAKALVGVGGVAPIDRALGFRLELIAGPVAGGVQEVRLLYEGRPLAGARVAATRRPAGATPIHARSDADGRVRLALDDGGAWLITAEHMIEAPAGLDAHWESFWASLTLNRSTIPGVVSERCRAVLS